MQVDSLDEFYFFLLFLLVCAFDVQFFIILLFIFFSVRFQNSSSQTPSHVEDGIELDSGEFKSPLPVPTPNILNSGGAKEVLVLHRDLRLLYS